MNRWLVMEWRGGVTRLPLSAKSPVLIGRWPDCHVVVTGDPGVSKHHARIDLVAGQPVLRDAGSTNGTLLRGRRLDAPVSLRPGDTFTVGQTEIRFVEVSLDRDEAVNGLEPGPLTRVIPIAEVDTGPPPAAEADPGQSSESVGHGILQRIACSLLTLREPDPLFRECLELILAAIPARRGCLMLLEDGRLTEKAFLARTDPTDSASPDILRFSQTVRKLVIEERAAVLTTNAPHNPDLEEAHSIIAEGIRSILCVPLWHGEATYGLIYLDSPFQEAAFNEANLRLLVAISNLVTIKIENANYFSQMLVKQKMERELAFASEVQRFLLPAQLPRLPGLEAHAFYRSCHQLGGDYYQCFPTAAGHFRFFIADVMGKGTGAALLTASLHAYLGMLCRQPGGLADMTGRLNQAIHDLTDGQFFITLFGLDVDPAAGRVEYCNAGHGRGLWVRAGGTVHALMEGGLMLGVTPDSVYIEGRLTLAPGDRVWLCTDGLSEAQNPAGEMLGDDCFERWLRDFRHLPAREVLDRLMAEVWAFQAEAPPTDDMTALLIANPGEREFPVDKPGSVDHNGLDPDQ